MPYIPPLRDYSPIYIQTASDASAVNITSTYGVVALSSGYPLTRKRKEPFKNEWHDQSGDDEYIGATPYYEAFSFTLRCAIFVRAGQTLATAKQTLKDEVRAFQNYLFNGGQFKFFDDNTKIGFRNVRVAEFPDPAEDAFSTWNTDARVIFSVVLKVNDPATEMILSNGNIVSA